MGFLLYNNGMISSISLIFLAFGAFQNPFADDSINMVELNSRREFCVIVENTDSFFKIKAEGGNLNYTEEYLLRNDTVFITKRIIKIGIIKINLDYEPQRIRMIMPFDSTSRWKYEGIEKGRGYKRHIKSYGYIDETEELIKAFNISSRGEKEDTSELVFDRKFNIKLITVQIPELFNFYRFLGFKSSKLIFKRSEIDY